MDSWGKDFIYVFRRRRRRSGVLTAVDHRWRGRQGLVMFTLVKSGFAAPYLILSYLSFKHRGESLRFTVGGNVKTKEQREPKFLHSHLHLKCDYRHSRHYRQS